MNTNYMPVKSETYQKPAIEVIEIQLEGSILQASATDDVEFDYVPGQTGVWP